MTIRNILVRRCLSPDTFDEAIMFYERIIAQPPRLRFDYPELELRLAQVANILFITGPEERLQMLRQTDATFIVDNIATYHSTLPASGATIIREPRRVPTGQNMLVRHPDGMVVEYVQHDRPNPADRLS